MATIEGIINSIKSAKQEHEIKKEDVAEVLNLLQQEIVNKTKKEQIKEIYETNPDTNAFTNAQKSKLEGLENFNDTAILNSLDNKIDKIAGKILSTNDFTNEEKEKLAELKSSKFIREFNSEIELNTITGEVGSFAYVKGGEDIDAKTYIWDSVNLKWVKQLSKSDIETPESVKTKYESNQDTNAFTDNEKQKLKSLLNYDDTDIRNSLNNKVEKITDASSLIRVYGINFNGDQTNIRTCFEPLAQSIPFRNSSGTFQVNMPNNGDDVVPKKYVDNLIPDAGNILTTNTTQDITGQKTFNGKLTRFSRAVQYQDSKVHTNYGTPSLWEIGKIPEVEPNQINFFPIDNFDIVGSTEDSGENWDITPLYYSDEYKAMLVGGDANSLIRVNTRVNTQPHAKRLKIELTAKSYCFLNDLVILGSMGRQTSKVLLQTWNENTNIWTDYITDETRTTSAEFVLHVSHPNMKFRPDYDAATAVQKVRIIFYDFIFNANAQDTVSLVLWKLKWFGTYPTTENNAFSIDKNKNVTFAAQVKNKNFPVVNEDLANKAYVDSLINGGFNNTKLYEASQSINQSTFFQLKNVEGWGNWDQLRNKPIMVRMPTANFGDNQSNYLGINDNSTSYSIELKNNDGTYTPNLPENTWQQNDICVFCIEGDNPNIHLVLVNPKTPSSSISEVTVITKNDINGVIMDFNYNINDITYTPISEGNVIDLTGQDKFTFVPKSGEFTLVLKNYGGVDYKVILGASAYYINGILYNVNYTNLSDIMLKQELSIHGGGVSRIKYTVYPINNTEYSIIGSYDTEKYSSEKNIHPLVYDETLGSTNSYRIITIDGLNSLEELYNRVLNIKSRTRGIGVGQTLLKVNNFPEVPLYFPAFTMDSDITGSSLNGWISAGSVYQVYYDSTRFRVLNINNIIATETDYGITKSIL